MNSISRTFTDSVAVRAHVPLLIGLMGPSASGKTFSALRLASGIQQVSGGEIFFIDTEARRALHYAEQFKFRHIDFQAPFGSLDYLAAITHCVKSGAGVVVVDSMSHEHIGPGGYLLTQDAEVDRMAGNDFAKRERVKMAAWIKPAALRQQMINGILQLNCNFIFAFRAKEKIKPMKIDGKLQNVEMGFMPIAGEEMLFEQTVNCLLLPRSGGVPTWRSDNVGERMMMKLPAMFEHTFPEGKPLDEETGRAMAQWARGGAAASSDVGAEAQAEARKGTDAFRAFWPRLSKGDRETLKPRLTEFQRLAREADESPVDDPFAETGEIDDGQSSGDGVIPRAESEVKAGEASTGVSPVETLARAHALDEARRAAEGEPDAAALEGAAQTEAQPTPLPKTLDEYRAHALAYVAAATSASALEARWKAKDIVAGDGLGDRSLRTKLNIDQETFDELEAAVKARCVELRQPT